MRRSSFDEGSDDLSRLWTVAIRIGPFVRRGLRLTLGLVDNGNGFGPMTVALDSFGRSR